MGVFFFVEIENNCECDSKVYWPQDEFDKTIF